MAVLCGKQGVRTAILCTDEVDIDQIYLTSEGETTVRKLTKQSASEYDLLSIQYVPNLDSRSIRYFNTISSLSNSKLHLMIHECWLIKTQNEKFTVRQTVKRLIQKLLLNYLIIRWNPLTIATSNKFYQDLLLSHGMHADVSPMLGNIPVGTSENPPTETNLPSWWKPYETKFMWASFGGLHCEDWDCNQHFLEARKYQNENGVNFYWAFVGGVSDLDKKEISKAAEKNGYAEAIFFTGYVETNVADWWLRICDAGLSGNPRELWGKSGGILATIERGKPVLLPRGKAFQGQSIANILSSIDEVISYQSLRLTESSLSNVEVNSSVLIPNFINTYLNQS